MEKKPKVAVIMSIYNGEKYLIEQIDSILKQERVEVDLHIFDDCSKDLSVEIAKEYEEKNKNVYVYINERNKNFTYNFIDGLFKFKDNDEYEYYAFSDQDDVWMSNKIISAIEKIKKVGMCTLYSSNLMITNQELQTIRPYRDVRYYPKKHDEIRYNIVTGCTMVFDNEMKKVFTKHYPKNMEYHDHWFGLIANCVKNANYVYDPNPNFILYRQHMKNASGDCKDVSFIKKIFQRTGKRETDFEKRKYLIDLSGYILKEGYRELIEAFVNYKSLKNKVFLIKHCETTHKIRFCIGLLTNKYINKGVKK